jgi:Ca-activated chloride channel family protein
VEEKKPVTDIFVAFDVSTSMLTEDLKPNRVAAAKKMLAQFLDKVQNVRVGLTVFAKVSFTQCPLTTDIDVVKQLLAHVDVFSVKLDGTAIGTALVSCLERLQDGSLKKTEEEKKAPAFFSRWMGKEEPESEETPNHQAIILLTDGGNNAGEVDPLTAAKIAASRGVKIYTIGVGSLKSVPAIYHIDGQPVYGGIDPRTGRVFMSEPADLALLKEIARITGGKSYSAQNNQSLRSILDDIAKLEKREISTFAHWEYQELAPFFLLAAFLLLILDWGLEMTVLRTLP